MLDSSDFYRRQIAHALYTQDQAQQYQFLMAAVRSVLQTACISVLEYSAAFVEDVEDGFLPSLSTRFMRPTDGLLEEVLTEGLALMRNNGILMSDAWSRGEPTSLRKRAMDWATHRNNRDGHGVVSATVVAEGMEWLPRLASDLVDGLQTLLPIVDSQGTAYLSLQPRSTVEPLKLHATRTVDEHPIVIRDITRRGDVWRVRYQTLDVTNSVANYFEFSEPAGFAGLTQTDARKYQQHRVPVSGKTWKPTVLLPSRQTDTFEGREAQLEGLFEWIEDRDSRACNVYGEGGIGKTTLVLEFLNSILDGAAEAPAWQPDVICYFTAKQTRWGPQGLQILHGIVPPLEDAIRDLVRCYGENLDKSWFEGSVDKLIAKAVTALTDLGLDRDGVLLVLDNTETLASSATEEQGFARTVGLISRRLARVLVTSRRREQMEAYPLLVPNLSENEGIALLERLSIEYDAGPLRQSGRPTKRKLVNKFGGRPLLLDVFARLVGRFQYSLESARDSVLRLASDDLGIFLYNDVWGRIEPDQRLVFTTLGQLGDSISGKLVEYVCSELDVQHSVLLDAFEKTRFGSILDYSTSYDLIIDPSARAFLASKFNGLGIPERKKVESAATNAGRRNRALLSAHTSGVTDRVAQAFRTDAAKAAKIAAARGDNEDAVFWYEEAINADVGNSALLGRFAYFLAKDAFDLPRAYVLAKESCTLDDADADCYFTTGHIAASVGEVAQCDRYADRARDLGFSPYRCSLQKAKARVVSLEKQQPSEPKPGIDAPFRDNHEIRQHLEDAAIADPRGPLDAKHMRELERLKNRYYRYVRLRSEGRDA
jgi:hypothetical protein